MPDWYELRVSGSAGTSGAINAAAYGIAVGENGRLYSLTSGGARRFESREEALNYLGKLKVSEHYQFEVVLCGARAAA